MNYQQRIKKAYQLLPAYSFLTGAPIEHVLEFANLLTVHESELLGERCGESGLNADQTPMQLCITSSVGEIQCRLIADPCSHESIPAQRYRRALQAMPSVHERTGTQANAALVASMLTHFSPSDPPFVDLFTRGVFWVGASLEKDGIAIYTDTSPHTIDSAWDHARQFIHDACTDGLPAASVIERLRAYCWLSSIGIEGSSPENSRIKLYARMYQMMPEGTVGNLFPPVNALIESGALSALVGDRGLSFEDVLFNFGFHATSGKLEDLKIDISGSALALDAAQLEKTVAHCCEALRLQPINVEALLSRFNLAPSFLGIAINTSGKKRLNIYLKAGTA